METTLAQAQQKYSFQQFLHANSMNFLQEKDFIQAT
jgi:hypothetical protein